MNTLKNTLGKLLLALAIMFSLSSCFDESSPPGCETVEMPVLAESSTEVEEGETIKINMPEKPDEETTVSIIGPKGVAINNYSDEATIINASQEKAGIYKIYYTRNYCKSEPALFTVKVNPPAVKCTIPDNVIRFQNLGYDLTYYYISKGVDNSTGKFEINGNGSQSDFDIFFGTSSAPTSARSYAIAGSNKADEVAIRVLLGGNWYYASGTEGKRMNITFENGVMVATFCEVKFTGQSLTLTGSGRLICK
ncbi:MAG: hypothetical protein ACXWDO_10435 [Bacteroidia bacterium]